MNMTQSAGSTEDYVNENVNEYETASQKERRLESIRQEELKEFIQQYEAKHENREPKDPMALENAESYFIDQDGIIKFADNLISYKELLHQKEQEKYAHLSGNQKKKREMKASMQKKFDQIIRVNKHKKTKNEDEKSDTISQTLSSRGSDADIHEILKNQKELYPSCKQ